METRVNSKPRLLWDDMIFDRELCPVGHKGRVVYTDVLGPNDEGEIRVTAKCWDCTCVWTEIYTIKAIRVGDREVADVDSARRSDVPY